MAHPPRIETLTRRADFLRLNRGHKFIASGFILRALPTPPAPLSQRALARQEASLSHEASVQTTPLLAMRVGYTVTKKSGNAVARNRIKRRFRALMCALLPLHGVAGVDYVLIARADAAESPKDVPFDVLRADLERALTRLQGRLR